MEVFDCRGACKSNPVGAGFHQPGSCARGIFCFRNSAIAGDIVDDRAESFQSGREFAIGEFGANQANFEILDAFEFSESFGDT